jgi:hypothetical protein
MQNNVYRKFRVQNVLADVTSGVGVVEGSSHPFLGHGHLPADVQEALTQAYGVASNETTFNKLMRVELHQESVFIGPRF